MLANLRQWRFSAPLRIADLGPSLAPLDDAGLRALLKVLAAPAPATVASAASEPTGAPLRFALRLANATWKLAQQAERLGEGAAGRALRDRVEILLQLLRTEGIETIDYKGRDFDFGEVWDKVVGSEEPKARPYIAAMKAPRVMYRGEVIQAGTPIVDDRGAAPSIGETS